MSINPKNFSMRSIRETLAIAEEILDRFHTCDWTSLNSETRIKLAESYLRLAEAKMKFMGPTAHYEEI